MKSALFSLLIVSAAAAQDPPPLTVVDSIDVSRYMGVWYEIARMPNSFQSDCIGDVTATYVLLESGQIRVVNRCKVEDGTFSESEGLAIRADDEEPNSKLKVRFAPAILSWLPWVWGDYWVIDLAPDYSHVVIGEPDREQLWILARTPKMDETVLEKILDRVRGKGYDLSGLMRTKQGE